jgi:hypothetical protein
MLPPDVRPAPAVRDLTPAEQTEFRERCSYQPGVPLIPADHATVAAFRVPGEHAGDVPTAWLIARKGEQFTVCLQNSAGGMVGHTEFGPESRKDVEFLFAPVDGRGTSMGLYTTPVAVVTLQADDGPEQVAIQRDGFWFLPRAERYPPVGDHVELPPSSEVDEATPSASPRRLIGLHPGVRLRGYAADGTLVYDSATDGPAASDCYTDPQGTTILVNAKPGDTPADCRRMLSWNPPPPRPVR